MRILIAEDDAGSRHLLRATLESWGRHVVSCGDGREALDHLLEPDAPSLAILDWMMPELDGPAVCRRVREAGSRLQPRYLILLTGLTERDRVVEGLGAGADDYVTKPFDQRELRARVSVGERVVALQRTLAGRVRELEAAFAQITQLRGLLPICAYCKKIRNDRNYWDQVEDYIAERADVVFSHGVCPDCFQQVADQIDAGG